MAIELSVEDINRLRDAQRLAEETIASLDKAERAGLDVKEQRTKVNDQLAKIKNILNVYG